MSLDFGNPVPPRFQNPTLFFVGFLVGLAVVLFSTVVVDQLGTAMFRRGFAKPFYIKGHRIHHSCLYYIIPSSYTALVILYFLGYVKPIWGSFWYNVGYSIFLIAITVSIDFIGDKFWPKIRKNVILHHEWIYTIVPVFIFTYLVNVII